MSIWETRVTHPNRPPPPMWLYFVQEDDGGAIKIGVARCVETRLRALQAGNPRPLRVLFATLAGLDGARYAARAGEVIPRPEAARWVEREWHDAFAHLRLRGEWFRAASELIEAIERLRERTPSAVSARARDGRAA